MRPPFLLRPLRLFLIFVGAGFFCQTVYGYDPDQREHEQKERAEKKQEEQASREASEKIRKLHEVEDLLGENHSSLYEKPDEEALRDPQGHIVRPKDIQFSGSQKNYTYGTEERSVPVTLLNKGERVKLLDLRIKVKDVPREIPLRFDQNRFVLSPHSNEKTGKRDVLKQTLGGISPLEIKLLEGEIPPKEGPLPLVFQEKLLEGSVALSTIHRSSSGTLIVPAVQGLCEGTVDGMKNLAGDLGEILLAAKDGVLVTGKAASGDPESQEKVKGVAKKVAETSVHILEILAVLTPPSNELRKSHPAIASQMDQSREAIIEKVREKAQEFGEAGKQWAQKFLQADSEDQARMISEGFGRALSNMIPVGVVTRFKQVAKGARVFNGVEEASKVEKVGKGAQVLQVSKEEIERLNQAFLKELKEKGFLGKSEIKKMYNGHLMSSSDLDDEIVETFFGKKYVAIRPAKGEVFYRYGTGEGQYWTRVEPGGQIQSMVDNSVSPHFNDFSKMTKITIKKDFPWSLYEGESAPLIGPIKDTPWNGPSSLVGGGNQVVIPDWVLEDPKFKKFVNIETVLK